MHCACVLDIMCSGAENWSNAMPLFTQLKMIFQTVEWCHSIFGCEWGLHTTLRDHCDENTNEWMSLSEHRSIASIIHLCYLVNSIHFTQMNSPSSLLRFSSYASCNPWIRYSDRWHWHTHTHRKIASMGHVAKWDVNEWSMRLALPSA